jgi:hypothetical protein
MNPIAKVTRALALSAALTALSVVAPTAASAQWFAPSSFWNTPLSSQAQLDARSDTWVQHLAGKVNTYGPWINTSQYSVPIYTVPDTQPTTRVWIDNYAPTYQRDFQAVPIPANAQPAAGTDHHLVISQPSTNTMWEFWNAYKALDGSWHAGSGAKIPNVSSSDGLVSGVVAALFPAPYGATATALPLVGGLITPAELSAGQINHVVALAIPHPLQQWWWSWPAQRSDGDSQDACDVPEGTRFRLPASLDISSLHLSPTATTIARAVQEYGMVVRDRAAAVTFYAQDPINMLSNPYPALFGNQNAAQALAGFPWASLQALQSQPNQVLPTGPVACADTAPPASSPSTAQPQPSGTSASADPQASRSNIPGRPLRRLRSVSHRRRSVRARGPAHRRSGAGRGRRVSAPVRRGRGAPAEARPRRVHAGRRPAGPLVRAR